MKRTDFETAANTLLKLSQKFSVTSSASSLLDDKIRFCDAHKKTAMLRRDLLTLVFDAEEAESFIKTL